MKNTKTWKEWNRVNEALDKRTRKDLERKLEQSIIWAFNTAYELAEHPMEAAENVTEVADMILAFVDRHGESLMDENAEER